MARLHQSSATLRTTPMGSNYEQLFTALPRESCPDYLCERIVEALERERERVARTQLVLSSLTGISSLAGLMFALPALERAAAASGFTQYVALITSDGDFVLAHLDALAMPLAEALPGFETTLTLVLVAALLVSLHYFARGIVCAHFTIHSPTRRAA